MAILYTILEISLPFLPVKQTNFVKFDIYCGTQDLNVHMQTNFIQTVKQIELK